MDDNTGQTSTWANLIWSIVIACIGFGFAVYRYLQFSGHLSENAGIRLSRIERPIYRLAGLWGLIAAFLIIGVTGLYYAIRHYKQLRSKK